MRMHRIASIDRLMARRAAKAAQSEMMKTYMGKNSPTSKSALSRAASMNGVRVELSLEAERLVRKGYIDSVLESGAPLNGINYNEYRCYYEDKYGYIDDRVKQFYKQALKGDDAALRNREWRTNPSYEIPQRLFNDPWVTADRNAAIEKIRNGEELKEWEHQLLNTFPDAVEGNRIYIDAMIAGQFHKTEKRVAEDLAAAGIELASDEEIQFEVWGYDMKVSGNLDDDKLQAIYDAVSCRSKSLYSVYTDTKNQMSPSDINECFQLIYAENYLKDTGVSLFDISLDDNGNLVGLPDELADFINNNVDKPLIISTSKGWDERDSDVQKARLMRDTFKSAVRTIANGRYDYYRSKTAVLTFKNGVLSC